MAFADIEEPTDKLTMPEAPKEFHDLMDATDEFLESVSPGAQILHVLTSVIGWNPVEKVTGKVIGDWESFGRCADVFDKLGEFDRSVSRNIASGNQELDRSWDGSAADQAWIFFDRLSGTLASQHEPLHELGDQYRAAAHGAWSFCKAAEHLCADMIDAGIMLAMSTAAGGASAETGIGPLIAAGVDAYEIWKIIEMSHELVSLISKTDALIRGVVGAVAVIYGTSGDGPLGALARNSMANGAGGYDHPNV
jgi:hypothetical protein